MLPPSFKEKQNMTGAVPESRATRWDRPGNSLLAVIATVLTVSIFPLACGSPSPQVLHICTNQWPGYEPLYLARSLGYFDERDVQLVEYSSASDCMRAFGNGSVEAAALTLAEALQLAEDGIDLKILFVIDFSNGAHVLLARPEIRTLASLKGRRIGIEMTATGAYVLLRALEKGGLRPRDVTIVGSVVSDHERQYRSGRIDAVVTFDPTRRRLQAAGMREHFSSREIPREIVDVLVVRRKYAEGYPGDVEKIRSAWYRALNYLRANPQEAAERMAPRLQLSPTEFREMLTNIQFLTPADNRKLLEDTGAGLVTLQRQIMETLIAQKLLRRPVAVERLL